MPEAHPTPVMRHLKGLGDSLAALARDLLHPPSQTFTKAHRDAVEEEVQANAGHSGFYYGLVFCACGIATLGLLQSSVAVVIGAMLISPLMGPIMGMGLSLAELDLPSFRRAAITLGMGVLISILAAVLIVWVSPLKEVTSEILARTRPTLLDLVVAALSGLVGGFVTVSNRGGIIAGVAIATALMPPLATVGFGLATGSMAIAGGATLLFITNVVAILGAVFIVARRYGFRPIRHQRTRWEAPILSVVTLILCAPLALSLNNIVSEAHQTNRVRNTIESLFVKDGARINDLHVVVEKGKVTDVQAVVITHTFVPGAQAQFEKRFPGLKTLNIEQVVAAHEDVDAISRKPDNSLPSVPSQVASLPPDQFLSAVLGHVASLQGLQSDDSGVTAQITLKTPGTLSDYRALETAVQALMPDTKVTLIPPSQPLLAITFAKGSATLDDQGRNSALASAWAIRRWGGGSLQIVGSATTTRLATLRAEAVARALDTAGADHAPVAVAVSKDAPDMVSLFRAPEPPASKAQSSSASAASD
ncbi:DUF389 domain-containing protein [Asticcacaulis sp. EMRT-3]|uniref:DUF389 domain-containing protein n=1 Tax=Asticcacaulis sp. EMRT-3 TaxID=3040349 RepID=UPI0024AF99C3|nr:DUF389 domain-containing protein [Asticcacaulis sp. EMRT-3]MDI7776337.1 DUF389 domain-containing protein [Asticcacaulis sp. EMRT-3]